MDHRVEVLSCERGSLTAWAMLKSHYPDHILDLIVHQDPRGPDGEPVKPESLFQPVLPYALAIKESCSLEHFKE